MRFFIVLFIFSLPSLMVSNPFEDLQADLKKAQDALNSIVRDKDEGGTTNSESPGLGLPDTDISSPDSEFEAFAKLFETNVGSELITERIVQYDDFGDELVSYRHYAMAEGMKIDVHIDSSLEYAKICKENGVPSHYLKQGFPFDLTFPIPSPKKAESNVKFKIFDGYKSFYNDLCPGPFSEDVFCINKDYVSKSEYFPNPEHPFVILRRSYEKAVASGDIDSSSGFVTLAFNIFPQKKEIIKFSPFHSSWIDVLRECKKYIPKEVKWGN